MKIFKIQTSTGQEKEVDIESVIKKYIEYSVGPKAKQDENGSDVEPLPEEKGHYKKCLDEARGELGQVCKLLATETPDQISEYLLMFVKMYEEDKENRRHIKKALLEDCSYNLIKKFRVESVDSLYEAIGRIEQVVPMDDNCYFTFNPISSIYGWSKGSEKEKGGLKAYPPLPNEAIVDTLKAFENHDDKERLSKWVVEILAYNKKNYVSEAFADKYEPERLVLQRNLSIMMKEDKKLKALLMVELLEGNLLFDLVNQSKEALRVGELEEEIKKQEEKYKKESEEKEKDYWKRAEAQKQIIQEKSDSISKLMAEQKEFEGLEVKFNRASEQLTTALSNLKAQQEINEDIKKSDMEKIQEKEKVIEALERDLLLTKSELTERIEELDALSVDMSLKNNEIERLKESVGSKDSDATEKLLKSLASDLNNQIFYLSMFYEILSEDNGVLDEMNREMFKNVLTQVDAALAGIGLKKLGNLGDVVDYDSSIHNSISESIANGEKVKVTGFGWEINNDVYIKIPVEKEVQ
ncbi:hypothetical protein [Butyrivibrio sp. YAB3001]|uniref:hypothetical protein n=1 Tax=Butyrivibrio sp. YAB3001 TaxID=1520812 RepID=UPI0008F641C4|nr:hypothetical protein [Butyrivibrio sp. YAB3001]SFC66660.1 hypothetical protein SAMN02910398_02836 [Butyrivibrio sp. YAB3001]